MPTPEKPSSIEQIDFSKEKQNTPDLSSLEDLNQEVKTILDKLEKKIQQIAKETPENAEDAQRHLLGLKQAYEDEIKKIDSSDEEQLKEKAITYKKNLRDFEIQHNLSPKEKEITTSAELEKSFQNKLNFLKDRASEQNDQNTLSQLNSYERLMKNMGNMTTEESKMKFGEKLMKNLENYETVLKLKEQFQKELEYLQNRCAEKKDAESLSQLIQYETLFQNIDNMSDNEKKIKFGSEIFEDLKKFGDNNNLYSSEEKKTKNIPQEQQKSSERNSEELIRVEGLPFPIHPKYNNNKDIQALKEISQYLDENIQRLTQEITSQNKQEKQSNTTDIKDEFEKQKMEMENNFTIKGIEQNQELLRGYQEGKKALENNAAQEKPWQWKINGKTYLF